MAVTKLSNSGIKTGVLKYDSMLAGNATYDPGATWLIQRVAGTGSSNTITFSSIPQTYQHLQIRYCAKDTRTGTNDNLRIRFNSDTGTNYARHTLRGDGVNVSASGAITETYIQMISVLADTPTGTSNIMSAGIIDIHDYANSSKNKTVRAFAGVDYNLIAGTATISLNSGLWINTNAITSIDLISSGTAFTTSSTFALYGYKGA